MADNEHGCESTSHIQLPYNIDKTLEKELQLLRRVD